MSRFLAGKEVLLGTSFQNRRPYRLHDDMLAWHKCLLGISGMGKSSLLAAVIIQLLSQCIPICLLDPHGDLCRTILRVLIDEGYFQHKDAFSRLIYLDFGRTDRYPAYNLLSDSTFSAHTHARLVLESWKRAFPEISSGAVNLENILLSAIVTLVENHLPLTHLSRLLTDEAERERLVVNVSDPVIRDFWNGRFSAYGRAATSLIESTMRRAFLLTFSYPLRFSLGQSGNLLPFRRLMDSGTSVLINLAGLDPDSLRFLGCLATVGMEFAALSRADLPESQRSPYTCAIDESALFSSRSAQSFTEILAQTRKYGLSLVLAYQYLDQLDKKLQAALGNTGCQIFFRLSGEDAGSFGVDHLFSYDPFLVKESGYGRRPSYYSQAEQRTALEETLRALPPRVAYVRANQSVSPIYTIGVSPSPESGRKLHDIEEEYARRYLTQRTEIDFAQQALPNASPSHVHTPQWLPLTPGWVPIEDPLDDFE
jgi:hypothetical protein